MHCLLLGPCLPPVLHLFPKLLTASVLASCLSVFSIITGLVLTQDNDAPNDLRMAHLRTPAVPMRSYSACRSLSAFATAPADPAVNRILPRSSAALCGLLAPAARRRRRRGRCLGCCLACLRRLARPKLWPGGDVLHCPLGRASGAVSGASSASASASGGSSSRGSVASVCSTHAKYEARICARRSSACMRGMHRVAAQ